MRIALTGRAILLVLVGVWCVLPKEALAADWVAPLPEPLTITRAFDPPADPYGSGHRGVDLAGNPGQPVVASGAGAVVFAGPLAGRDVISIQHGEGLRTTYEPVSPAIAAGMSVSPGQVIGTLDAGHPGCPVEACLHWGLKRGELYLDPLLLLSQGPVRLLPRYGTDEAGSRPGLGGPAGTFGLTVLGLLPMARGSRRLRLRLFTRAGGPGGRPP